MLKKDTTKTCLVVSYGPVPTPDHQTVEGGGMRAWGLALGLKENGVEVTIGINKSFPQKLRECEGVKLINWSLDSEFIQLINSFDTVVVSYCMGDPSVFIADNINDNVQLILDAYVPIYIEVSARDSKDVKTEYENYMDDIGRFNKVLKRGDFFLSANAAQEMLYSGVLSALGIINPRSYRSGRILKTPFGIHRTPLVSKKNPYNDLFKSGKDDFIVLWFGGIYPWFRIQEYLDAIEELSTDKNIKFVFVGGKNPFNPNPDFSRQYETAFKFSQDHSLLNRQIFFVDWVDFDDRVDWFIHADTIVSLNQPGDENKYSWRTRVMDFVWGEAVTITNGGDPLSEELIEKDAAVKLDTLTTTSIVTAIKRLKKDPGELELAQKNLKKIKEKYYWDVVTKQLVEKINEHSLPYLDEYSFKKTTRISTSDNQEIMPSNKNVFILTKSPFTALRKIKSKGIIRSTKLAGSIVKNQIKNTSNTKREPQFIFISHPINNTGAPIVLLQIVEEYVKKYGSNRVRVITPGIEKEQEQHLRSIGINVEKAVFSANLHLIRLQLSLKKDDFVLMNTIAIYDNYRDFVLLWLRLGRLRHAYWFIHEDVAQIPIINAGFLNKKNIIKIEEMTENESLSLLFPSKRTAEEYKNILGVNKVKNINLHVEVPENLKKIRKPSEYKKLNFLLSGTSTDGRKGQLIALAAFHTFMKNYQEKNPDLYRDFKLHLVAIKDDYISKQIKWIGASQLGKHLTLYEPLPKKQALDITSECNVVICCSLNETFGLYIAEAMQMGHVVLRNSSAGVDEQLREGRNGYLIDEKDINQFASVLEKVLNKRKTSDESLCSMGLYSQKMMSPYGSASYLDSITSTK